jgi:hypothetical protein
MIFFLNDTLDNQMANIEVTFFFLHMVLSMIHDPNHQIDLANIFYTINITTKLLKFEQVALMLSGMGSALSDVFRMVIT